MSTEVINQEEIEVLKRLNQKEQEFVEGIKGYQIAGKALEDIQVNKLYRFTYPNFETYCQDRSGVTAKRGYQLIKSYQVYNNLSRILDNPALPANAAQAEALSKVPPDKQGEAWEQAQTATGKPQPTAKEIEASAEDYMIPKSHSTRGKGTKSKSTINTSGFSQGPSVDSEFDQSGEPATLSREEWEWVGAGFDTDHQCPYCGRGY